MTRTRTETGSCRSAVFLDRDGTLLDDPGYLANPDGIVFFSEVIDSLKRLREAGYLLMVITNQSGVGRGYFDEETGIAVNLRMADMLREQGVELAGIYYCSHHPDDGCLCRKPGTLMAGRAIRDHGVQRESSWMIGDTVKDILMGMKAGLRPIMLMTGKLPKEDIPVGVPVKKDLGEAAQYVIGEGGQ